MNIKGRKMTNRQNNDKDAGYVDKDMVIYHVKPEQVDNAAELLLMSINNRCLYDFQVPAVEF
jgi:hypothetical protein